MIHRIAILETKIGKRIAATSPYSTDGGEVNRIEDWGKAQGWMDEYSAKTGIQIYNHLLDYSPVPKDKEVFVVPKFGC